MEIMFNISYSTSTGSNPSNISQVDAPERLMRRIDAKSESSIHAPRALREILAQKPGIMEAWNQALEDCDDEYYDNVD